MSVIWPQEININTYPIHSYNELFIAAPPEKIWNLLIDAQNWPQWYSNSKNVQINDIEKFLKAGTKFNWRTFSTRVESEVKIYKPYTDLGWTAFEMLGWQGFHCWKIIPQEHGCLVITEEVQKGFGAKLIATLVKKSLERGHQQWLIGIHNQTNKL